MLRLQQTDDLAEKRQVDAGTSPHHRAANLDLDRRGAGSGTAFRHNRHKIRHRYAGIGDRGRRAIPVRQA